MIDPHKVKVWDLPTRLFHWALALCLIGSWITVEAGYDWMQWHLYLGYASLTLILFRVLWGLFGTRHARFSSFLTSPLTAIKALPHLINREPSSSAGHSETGGWATVLLLSAVLSQASSGLFISDDILWAGPYNPAVTNATANFLGDWHEINFHVLQALVVLHLLVIGWYSWGKREQIVPAMITGNKAVGPDQGIENSALLRALVLLIVVIAGVVALVMMAPEPSMDDYF